MHDGQQSLPGRMKYSTITKLFYLAEHDSLQEVAAATPDLYTGCDSSWNLIGLLLHWDLLQTELLPRRFAAHKNTHTILYMSIKVDDNTLLSSNQTDWSLKQY